MGDSYDCSGLASLRKCSPLGVSTCHAKSPGTPFAREESMTDCNANMAEGMQALQKEVRCDHRFPEKLHRSDVQSPPITTLGASLAQDSCGLLSLQANKIMIRNIVKKMLKEARVAHKCPTRMPTKSDIQSPPVAALSASITKGRTHA